MQIKLSAAHKAQLLVDLREGSLPSVPFFGLVVLSTTIAAFGLLANSTAVVIGAMLIAPLMGPIFGITLALIRNEHGILWRALLAEVGGVLLAVAVAFLIGCLPLHPSFDSEILARTQPTLFDLLIAFFSGLAGAYALVNPRVSPTIAGVAIATALVPPLATCGLCLAAGNPRLGFGAFLLFVINFLAIQLAAAIVFLLADLEERGHQATRRRLADILVKFGPGFTVLIVLGVFLTNVVAAKLAQRHLEIKVTQALSQLLSASQGAHLTTGELKRSGSSLEFVANIITPQAFTPTTVSVFEDELAKAIGHPVRLVLRNVLTRDVDRNGPAFITDEERIGLHQQEAESELLQQASALIGRELRNLPGVLLMDLRRDKVQQGLAFTATMQAPNAIAPATVAALQAQLETHLRRSVRLIVRTIQTRDADAERFIYTEEALAKELNPGDQELQAALETSLGGHVARLVSGSSLQELSFQRAAGRLQVSASVRAPRAISPPEVQRLQHELRLSVAPEADLTIHTSVEASATAAGYLNGAAPPAAAE